MKTRMRSTKLLAMTVALAALAAVWAVWGARPAKAIVIIGGKTGMFTVTHGEAVRVNVVNTSDLAAIIDDGKVVDSEGHTVFDSSMQGQRLDARHGISFEFMPRLAEGQRLAVRVEVMIEGDSVKEGK